MTYHGYIDADLFEMRARMADACRAALDEVDKKLRYYEAKGVLKLWESGDSARLKQLRREINKTLFELQGFISPAVVNTIESSYTIGALWEACTLSGTLSGLDFSFAGVNRNLLKASVSRDIAGLTVSDRLSQERLDLLWHERDAIAKSQLLGYGADKTARQVILEDVQQGVESSYSRAMNIARTETTRNATAAIVDTDKEANAQGIETRNKWHAGKSTLHPHDPPHSTYNGKVADTWSDEYGRYIFMIGGMPSGGPGHCENTKHNYGCRCCLTTICIGYEEFYPTDEDFKKYAEKYKTSAVQAA